MAPDLSKDDINHHSTLIMAQSLNSQECSEFEFVTIQSRKILRKRDALWLALQEARKREQKIGRKELFLEVFGEKWAPEKDYLLRNELRHLGKALKEFITLREFKRQLEAGRLDGAQWLVEGIHRRAEPELAEKIYKAAVRRSEKKTDPGTLRSLLRLKLRLLAEETEFKEENFKEMIIQSANAIRALGKESAYELAEINAVRAHAESVLWSLDPAFEFHPPAPLPVPPRDAYLEYLERVIIAAQQTGKDRQQSFLEALNLLDQFDTPRLDNPSVRGRLENNVALEYMHQGNFEQAIFHFGRALNPAHKFPIQLRQVIRFNQITAMLRSGKNESAYTEISLLKQEQIQHPQILTLLPKMEVQALIQLERFAEARKAIPPEGGSGSQADQQFMRLCLAISWFRTGDPELALRETGNMRKNLRNAGVLNHFRAAAGWLQNLILLTDSPASAKTKGQLQKLYQETEKWFSENPGPHAETLPIKWIRQEIAKKVSPGNS